MESSGPYLDQLSIVIHDTEDGAITFALNGELDPHTAPALEEALASSLETDAIKTITLDIQGLGFMDASGMRVLIASQQQCAQTEKELVVQNPSATIARLFEITGLNDHITIIKTSETGE